MKQFILSTLALVGASAANLTQEDKVEEFMQFVGKHGKSYASMEEFEMRLAQFNKKDAYIKEKMQAKPAMYTLGHNQFSDYTESEIKQTLGFKESEGARRNAKIHSSREDAVYPESWDWRMHGAVTPVKDQAACGSCWTFATVATLEGAHQINTGQLLTFSEGMFVSCVKNQTDYGYETEDPPCCYGCNGGDADASYLWAKTNNINLVLENDWKYAPVNGTCEYESMDQTRVQVIDYYDIPSNQSSLMMDAAAQQPVAVNIDASTLHSYESGILDSTFGCGTDLNHVVTIVGWGQTTGETPMKYWIVRNSWGTKWGENGYFRLQNTDDNTEGICGVNWKASYPTVATKAN